MAKYSFKDTNKIEIDFGGIKPPLEIRNKMKAVKYCWDPANMVWLAPKNNNTILVAQQICGESPAPVISEATQVYVQKKPAPKD